MAVATPASMAEIAFRAQLASRTSQPLSIGVPSGLNVTTSYPATFLLNSYAAFASWARGSLEIVRPQLIELCYPFLVHCALELLLSEDTASYTRELESLHGGPPITDAMSAARYLLEMGRGDFAGAHSRELAALAILADTRQLFGASASSPAAGSGLDDSASPTNFVIESLLELGGSSSPAAPMDPATARQRRAARLETALKGIGQTPLAAVVDAVPPALRKQLASAIVNPADPRIASGGRGVVDGEVAARFLDPAFRYRVTMSPLALQLALEFLTRNHSIALLGFLNERVAVVVSNDLPSLAALGSISSGAVPLPPASALPYPGVDALSGPLRSAETLAVSASGHLSGGNVHSNTSLHNTMRWGVLPSSAHPGSLPPHGAPAGGAARGAGSGIADSVLVGRITRPQVPWPDYLTSPLGRALLSSASELEQAAASAKAAVAAALGKADKTHTSVRFSDGNDGAAPASAGEKRGREAELPTGAPAAAPTVQLTALTVNTAVSAAPSAAALLNGGGASSGSATALTAASLAPVTATAVIEFPASAAAVAASESTRTGDAAAGGASAITDDDDGLLRITAAGFADGHLRVFATIRLALTDAASAAPAEAGYRTVDIPVVLTSSPESARASRSVTGVAISACGRYVLTSCLDGAARLFSVGPQVRAAVRAVLARTRAGGSVTVIAPPAHRPAGPLAASAGKGASSSSSSSSLSGLTVVTGGAAAMDVDGGSAASSTAALLESLLTETLHPLATYSALGGSGLPLWAAAFNPLSPGVFATAGRDGTARIWSSAFTGQPAITCGGHVSDATAVAWHPNGLYVISGGGDGAVRVHEAPSGDCVRLLLGGHGAPVTAIAPAPCGRWIATGDEDGVVALWEVATGSLVARGYGAGEPSASGLPGVSAGAQAPSGAGPASPIYALSWDTRTGSVLAAGDGAGAVGVWGLAAVVER